MHQVDFVHGSVGKAILQSALPMFVAQFFNLLYNIVEKEDAHGHFRDGVLVPPAESTNDSELYNTIRKVMTKVGDYV